MPSLNIAFSLTQDTGTLTQLAAALERECAIKFTVLTELTEIVTGSPVPNPARVLANIDGSPPSVKCVVDWLKRLGVTDLDLVAPEVVASILNSQRE